MNVFYVAAYIKNPLFVEQRFIQSFKISPDYF